MYAACRLAVWDWLVGGLIDLIAGLSACLLCSAWPWLAWLASGVRMAQQICKSRWRLV